MRYLILLLLILSNVSLEGQKLSLDQVFVKYEEKSFNTDDLIRQTQSRFEDKIFIQLDRWNLELEASEILAEDYQFLDENGNQIFGSKNRPIPMNGYTSNGGRVSITIGHDFIYGFIEEGNDRFYIEPSRFFDKSRGEEEFILYNTKDVREHSPVKCGVQAVHEKEIQVGKRVKDNERSAGLCYDVEYAIVNDWSMFSKYGAAGLEARNIAITNDVNTNYLDAFSDEIRFVITGQWNATCSSCNPFGVSSNLNSTLDNFTAWGQSNLNNQGSSNYIRHDVASLWSDLFANSGTIGLAWVGVICGSSKYNVLSDFTTDAERLRVLTAHELGHNFAASHDASGAGTIMAPSVNNTNSWSTSSVSSINNHLNSRTCLETCSDFPATVFFTQGSGSVLETESTTTGGTCQEEYVNYSVPISISKSPSANVSVSLNTSGSSASVGYDFQLTTTSITFTPGGPLTQNVNFRIYDDAIVENPEILRLNCNVTSGPGEASSANSMDITINSNDVIESLAGGGDTIFYGNNSQSLSGAGFFDGRNTDQRSRFLISAATLQSQGVSAGEIDLLAFYVYEKNTTGTFQNFRIGMTEVTQNTLDGVGWLSTTTVFTGNFKTTESAWNAFNLTNPFDWDGTSNIYVEICFDNSVAIGHDRIIWFSTGSSQSQMLSYSTNALNACGFVSNWSYYYDRAPVLLIGRKGSTGVETALNASADGRIKAGETANLFSAEGKIIASIKNTGSSNLQCLSGTIDEAGTGRRALLFGNGQFTDKAFYIESSNNGTYELTLYFTEEELSIWGSEQLTLNFLKSSLPFSSANANSSEIINTSSVNTNIGAPNTIAYKTSSSGNGYFALTNGTLSPPVTANVASTWLDADVVIDELGKGVVLRNTQNDQYLVGVDGNGNLIATLDNSLMPESRLPEGDLCILTPGRSLVIRRNANAFTALNVDNDGTPSTSNISSAPGQAITLDNGNFGLLEIGGGIIFQNLQNECYKLYIDANGAIRTGEVDCP